jgi:hypothetical protein
LKIMPLMRICLRVSSSDCNFWKLITPDSFIDVSPMTSADVLFISYHWTFYRMWFISIWVLKL